jgi:hypothetical protein
MLIPATVTQSLHRHLTVQRHGVFFLVVAEDIYKYREQLQIQPAKIKEISVTWVQLFVNNH